MSRSADPVTRPHLRALALLGAAVALVIAGCTGVGSPPSPAPSSGASPGLSVFHDQEPAWGPCDEFATTVADTQTFGDEGLSCARIEVPLDYETPDGPRAQIAVMRRAATGERIGSLVMNPGGPGQSGLTFLASPATAATFGASALAERFDLVSFDPRGVGATTPRADCFTGEEEDSGVAFGGTVVPDITSQQEAQAFADRCVERTGGVDALTNLGTSTVVDDLDVIREVLGDDQLSYLGYSYGTELGAMYAEAYPDHVRAMVLDSVIDPRITPAEFRISQFNGFQAAFDALAAFCAEQADCPLGTDPSRATERFHQLVRPLADDPLPTSTPGRTLDNGTALDGVIAGLYSRDGWPAVINGLKGIRAGDGSVLLGMRDLQLARQPDGSLGADPDVLTAIRCMDWPARTPAEQQDMVNRIHELAPMLDVSGEQAGYVHECAAWPEPPSRPEQWLSGDVEVPPTLIIGSTQDPATPFSGATAMADALGGGLLTVEGSQHGILLLKPNECVEAAGERYLIDLALPEPGATCTL